MTSLPNGRDILFDDAGGTSPDETSEELRLIASPTEKPDARQLLRKVQRFLIAQFLPVGFVAALAISIVWPLPGKALADMKVCGFGVMQTLFVCIIFLVSGLCFNTSDVKGVIRAAQGLVFGILSILIFTPMSGLVVTKLSFIPEHFRIGLCVFVAVPTTLTVGVALVEQAGGNTALALMLTVLSNILGILTVPFAIQLTIGSEFDASIDAVNLLLKLLFTILLPLGFGKGLRETSPKVAKFVSENRSFCSLVKNAACTGIVWLSLSHSRKELVSQKAHEIASLVVLCSLIHVAFLTFNFACCYLIGLRRRELMSVVILASQKTFPVSLAVISYLDPDQVGSVGLLTIPCIIAHMSQLFIDSFVLARWKYDSEFE